MSRETLMQVVTDKLSKLQNAKDKVESTLRAEIELEWGMDAVMRRQSLRHEHGVITEKILSLKNMALDVLDRTGDSFLVEHNGEVRSFRLVPSHLVDPSSGLISAESVFAQFLMRSPIGGFFSLETPTGTKQYCLVDKAL